MLADISFDEWRLCFAESPTEVKIGVFIISFYSISEQTMVIRCYLYLIQLDLYTKLQVAKS